MQNRTWGPLGVAQLDMPTLLATMYPPGHTYAFPAVGHRYRVHCALSGPWLVRKMISNISLVKAR
ncbi:uncharacterized protein ColSpa_02297 [Colletotrichum spaethianum]|uniref:Uncharacterized protein n=1 Tax=Colletotrichum spaethianum TaxID=700344 RepID=A0AA37L508_9PEZI|nr:uncharacterized protein ColSpa_02297 [Colletotrichum spaethianum]GKT42116.1 hypothetical protein ColSpa_02297 [Colletotrichum spaethianum]